MSSMRAELSPTERQELLRDLWVAHDGRWFLKTAQEYGFDATSTGATAVARSLLNLTGRTALEAIADRP